MVSPWGVLSFECVRKLCLNEELGMRNEELGMVMAASPRSIYGAMPQSGITSRLRLLIPSH